MSVGAEVKPVTEAWYAITAKHSNMAALLISSDEEKGKVSGQRALTRDT